MKSEEQPVVCARVPAKVKRTLGHLAKAKGVNLSEYLRWLLIEHAEKSDKKR
jgi:hypothetical protein